MSRRASSCLHGPRPGPVSSSRSSSSIDNQESGDGSLRLHNHSKDMAWPMSTTSSQSSFIFSSDGYDEPIDLSTSHVELKCKSHTHHLQKPEGRRPLPPIPQCTHRPSLSISVSSSANSTGQRRPRWLPVPPLPMASFPTSEYKLVLLAFYQVAYFLPFIWANGVFAGGIPAATRGIFSVRGGNRLVYG